MFTRSQDESQCRFDATFSERIYFMIYVGIDVASEKHDVCIMSEDGEIFGKKFQIKNSNDEYKKLLNKINDAKKLFKDSKVRIGIESTGVYSSTIVNYFSKIKSCEVIYINPVLTNMFQHSETVHYAKTDAIDAEGICNFLQQKKKKLFTYTPLSYHNQETKSLCRELNRLNKQLNQEINRLTSLMHTIFPEFFQVFPKIRGKLCLTLLLNYPTPRDYKGKHASSIHKLGFSASKGHFSENKAELLLSLANNSIGFYSIADKLIIKQLAQSILLHFEQKQELIKSMTELVKEHCPKLLKIPGIGGNIACCLYGEIGNISNFHNADALVAFSGINPLVYESGNFKAKNTNISKKGSSYLRNALIQASRIIVKYDSTFEKYFNKKKAEGKHYNNCINHVAKKLVRVLHHLLKKDDDYSIK